MATIHVQTEILKKGEYLLMRSVSLGYDFRGDVEEICETEDRLMAAIINVGKACRFLADNYGKAKTNYIRLASDTDGLDKKYGGEHNVLFSLLFPATDYETRKFASLYAEYNKYLYRIRELVCRASIRIQLTERKENEIF